MYVIGNAAEQNKRSDLELQYFISQRDLFNLRGQGKNLRVNRVKFHVSTKTVCWAAILGTLNEIYSQVF